MVESGGFGPVPPKSGGLRGWVGLAELRLTWSEALQGWT